LSLRFTTIIVVFLVVLITVIVIINIIIHPITLAHRSPNTAPKG
jgi:hypothetical protein